MADEVIEISGASELWDVVAAIQHLAESYTGSTVDESSRIPAAVVAERLDQLTDRSDSTAGCFDPPFPSRSDWSRSERSTIRCRRQAR